MNFPRLTALILALAVLVLSCQGARANPRTLAIDISGPGQRRLNIVLLPPRGLSSDPEVNATAPALAGDLESLIADNLSFLPFLNRLPVSAILGGDPSTGVQGKDVDFRALSLSQADLVLTTGWQTPAARGEANVELRLFETFAGRMLLGKAYSSITKDQLPEVADAFCAHLMKTLTGRDGFFLSKLAFVKRLGRDKFIYMSGPQGRDVKKVAAQAGLNLSPSWAPDARHVAFSRITGKGHVLCVADSATGRVKTYDFAGNTVISPVYDPSGQIAVTLDLTGVPNIYLLDKNNQPGRALAPSWAIDVSPSFTGNGTVMAFASGRLGNPQIFLLERATGDVRRVTYEGTYNTNPSISPDGRLVVFSRDTREGHRIFLLDLATREERQLTFGPGSDEEPAFGPDGYFICFTSSRKGNYRLYLTTRHGDEPKEVPTGKGEAMSPAWGLVGAKK